MVLVLLQKEASPDPWKPEPRLGIVLSSGIEKTIPWQSQSQETNWHEI